MEPTTPPSKDAVYATKTDFKNAVIIWGHQRMYPHPKVDVSDPKRVTLLCRNSCGFKAIARRDKKEGNWRVTNWQPTHEKECQKSTNGLVLPLKVVAKHLEGHSFGSDRKAGIKEVLMDKLGYVPPSAHLNRLSASLVTGSDPSEVLSSYRKLSYFLISLQ